MCACGNKSSGSSGGGSFVQPVIPQTCDYTLNSLEALKLVVTKSELSVVQSQINTYSVNCHFLRATVMPLFSVYNVALNL